MIAVPVKDLLEAGVHFGCRASRWNPRMKPFIFGKRNLIHIIDLRESLRGLIKATTFLHRLAAEGNQVLFVGTKRQASPVIQECAGLVKMPMVTERWLGGTLTNFTTIRARMKALMELEAILLDESFAERPKKEQASIMRDKRKMFRNLDGLRTMERLPGALVIVDPKKEHNAVREANKLGIPVIAILDTDCDPRMVDIPIPGNDDSMRSIQVLVKALAEAVAAGNTAYAQWQAAEEKRRADDEAQRREEEKKEQDATRKSAERRAAEMDALKAAQQRLRAERAAKTATEGTPVAAAPDAPEAKPAE
ncbi:MAG: 30S ribosomal protein S2 [Planctomycetes bacterium]|nr:30S ribosomal protein S2 [Planctomycetota bacterium]